MRIGNRLFPYPVLNNNKLFSKYVNSSFELSYTEEINEDSQEYILKSIMYLLNNVFLQRLIEQGKVRVLCIVESPATMYRKHFDIFSTPRDIRIPLTDINGKISVSAFAIATEDIEDFYDDDFATGFGNLHFRIEKNDILIADDGFTNKIDFNDFDDDKKASIFIVIKDKSLTNDTVVYEYDSDCIQISMPEIQWDKYNATKGRKTLQNMWFSIIAIPALTSSLQAIQKSGFSVDTLRMDYKWFNSFAVKYEDVYKKELSDDDFQNMDLHIEAQNFLNHSITKSVDDIFNIAMNQFNNGGDDDGD